MILYYAEWYPNISSNLKTITVENARHRWIGGKKGKPLLELQCCMVRIVHFPKSRAQESTPGTVQVSLLF